MTSGYSPGLCPLTKSWRRSFANSGNDAKEIMTLMLKLAITVLQVRQKISAAPPNLKSGVRQVGYSRLIMIVTNSAMTVSSML